MFSIVFYFFPYIIIKFWNWNGMKKKMKMKMNYVCAFCCAHFDFECFINMITFTIVAWTSECVMCAKTSKCVLDSFAIQIVKTIEKRIYFFFHILFFTLFIYKYTHMCTYVSFSVCVYTCECIWLYILYIYVIK